MTRTVLFANFKRDISITTLQRSLFIRGPFSSQLVNSRGRSYQSDWPFSIISRVALCFTSVHAAEQATNRRATLQQIPFAIPRCTAFNSPSLGRVLSGLLPARQGASFLAPKPTCLWAKHLRSLHLCLVVVARFLSWPYFALRCTCFVDLTALSRGTQKLKDLTW